MAFGRPRPAQAPAQAAPGPTTIAEVEAQIIVLYKQRAELRTALEALPTREQELLSRDAPDADFDRLDDDARQYRRRLARLELEERELLARAAQLRAEARRDNWEALVRAYSEAAEHFLSATRETERLRREVQQISEMGAAEGFVLGMQSCLPPPPPPTDTSWFEQSARTVTERTMPEPAAQPSPVYSLRFVRGWDRYNSNDVAGFPIRQAFQLTDMHVAEWIETPPPRPERDAPREPQRQLARPLS